MSDRPGGLSPAEERSTLQQKVLLANREWDRTPSLRGVPRFSFYYRYGEWVLVDSFFQAEWFVKDVVLLDINELVTSGPFYRSGCDLSEYPQAI